MNELITLENTENVIKEIEQAFYDIPFDNSAYQNEVFVVAAQITPERAYRSIGLKMMAKLRALNEARFGKMKEQIDLDEIEYKLSSNTLNEFDRRREEIKKQEILSHRAWTDKLINDAINELNTLYKHFKSLPRYTREQFEAGEKLHFEQRLNRNVLGIDGAKESLINMHDDIKALENFEKEFKKIETPQISYDQLNMASLTNLLKQHTAQLTPTDKNS